MIDIFKLADRPFAVAHICHYEYVSMNIAGEGLNLEVVTTYKCDCGKERTEIYNGENSALNIPTVRPKTKK